MVSCVIPTKNRPGFVRNLLTSLSGQKTDEIEIVVIDNDDSAETEKVVREFAPLVRHVRTGGLPMIDNWNRALGEAREEYTLLIEDKMRARPLALKKICEELKHTGTDVLTWRVATINRDSQSPGTAADGNSEVKTSRSVVQAALSGDWKTFNRQAPKGFNSAIRTKLISDIESKIGRKICRSVSPDYTLAFSVLLNTEKLGYIDQILYEFPENGPSQGNDTLHKRNLAAEVAEKLGCAIDDFWSHVPVKYLSVNNTIYNDMLGCLEDCGELEYELCWESYFIELADELGISGGRAEDFLLIRQALRRRSQAFKLGLLQKILSDFLWQIKISSLRKRALERLLLRMKLFC